MGTIVGSTARSNAAVGGCERFFFDVAFAPGLLAVSEAADVAAAALSDLSVDASFAAPSAATALQESVCIQMKAQRATTHDRFIFTVID